MTPFYALAFIAVLSVISNTAVWAMLRAARLPEWEPVRYPTVVAAMPDLDYTDEWRGLV